MVVQMRKPVLFLSLLMLVSVPAVAAPQGFTVDIRSEDTQVRPSEGDTAKFHITVTNRGDSQQTFQVTFETGTATDPAWYYLENSIMDIEPGESVTTTLYVTPGREALAGNWGPEIKVYPLGNSSNRFKQLVTFSVVRDRQLVLTDFSLPDSKHPPTGRVRARFTVLNVIQSRIPANEYRFVLRMAGKETTIPVPSLEPGDERTVTGGLNLTGQAAGLYTLEAELQTIEGTVLESRSAKIRIERVEDVVRSSRKAGGLLQTRTVKTVRNTGNVAAEDVEVLFSVPRYASPFVSFTDEPVKVRTEEGKKIYTWTIDSLAPGASRSFTASVNYWPLLFVVVILGIAGFVVYRQLRTVTIVKSGKREEDHHTIHLRVKNNTGRQIEEVLVRDFVPGIANLIEKFDSKKPDRIQPTEEGTELVWHMGSMDAGEERIVTYKLRPKVEVEGYISLPEAEVEYERGGREREKRSHPITAEFVE
ncbi:MAG: hypothetical protein SVU32_03335 [Candidatus Nanohaloarchaea archaeon]|nr:hypothetical protein [Candidatus Nanohaloarchaea archaeon]